MYENEWQIDPPKQLDRGVKRGAEQERAVASSQALSLPWRAWCVTKAYM